MTLWFDLGLAVFSFFLGSIPFGVLVARHKGVDIFTSGSGNPGATNVLRAVGPWSGLLVLSLDACKGLIPAMAARFVDTHQGMWFAIGLVAVVGHSVSPFAGFRGGKGVSTALGAAIGAAPWVALPALAVFILCLALVRYVSVASTAAVLSTLAFVALVPGQSVWLYPLFGALAVLVIWRHRSNYRRLAAGEEPKFTFKKPPGNPKDDSRSETEPPVSQELDPEDRDNSPMEPSNLGDRT